MPNIRHALLIAASPQTVYDAITTTAGLAAWWTPKASATAEVHAVASFPFGDGYEKRMRIESLVPQESVQWTCIQGDKEWIGTNISFKLLQKNNAELLKVNPEISGQVEQNPADQATMLLFQHDDWADYSATFSECSYTWAVFLRSLKMYCEKGKGTPWPTQHMID